MKYFFNKNILLVCILISAFWVRTYKIDSPIADWHSWRQADTAAVARNFYQDGFNPFLPKYNDMSTVSEITPVPNPNSFRFVEFPIYNSLVFFAYSVNGGVDEKLARLVNIVISLGSITFLYLISKLYLGEFAALLSAFIFAFLPFNIYYSRVILPETSLLFFCLGMFYFTNKWIYQSGGLLFSLSVMFTACAFLTKPMAAFYLFPLLYDFHKKEHKWWPIPKRYLGFLLLSFLPFLGWRLWILNHPEGIPAFSWLLNGNGIRFKPIFWHWILSDRLGREILGLSGSILFFIGLLKKSLFSEGLNLHLLSLSAIAYLIVFATGNVQHDYYQILILPVLVIFVARGFVALFNGSSGFISRIWTIPLAILLLVMMFYSTWREVKGLYQINNPVIVEAGRRADEILPREAIVIAPYNGDTSFLYQVNRSGWPITALPTKDLIDVFNAQYYISVSRDDKTNWITKYFEVIEETPQFVIADLTKQKKSFDKGDPEP